MTTLRRQRLAPHAALLLLVLSAVTVVMWQAVRAATTEQIVTDDRTGLAIYGYDPVAYFTDRTSKLGRDDLELKHAGVVWRFRNEGNREAFAADPDVYMPQYGGHDPVAIAQKIARAGHPDFWAIHDDRLYLFYSEAARNAFAVNAARTVEEADANWPRVSQTLAP